jgi:hypothetical protein
MASFNKVNPIQDCNAGAFFGKSVDSLEINFGPTGNGILTSLGPNGALAAVVRQIELTGTIEVLGQITANCPLISYNGGNANVGLRVLTSGIGADSAANVQAAIVGLGVYTVGNASAGFANVDLSSVLVNTFTF